MRDVMSIVSAALCGLVFGLGLIAAQLTDPARIIAFLDVAGDWEGRLLIVMVAASVVAAPAFAMARRTHHSWLGEDITLPNRTHIDSRLITGAAIFGVGWGLVGLCPGPALVLLGTFDRGVLIFLPAMIVGALLGRLRRPDLTATAKSPRA